MSLLRPGVIKQQNPIPNQTHSNSTDASLCQNRNVAYIQSHIVYKNSSHCTLSWITKLPLKAYLSSQPPTLQLVLGNNMSRPSYILSACACSWCTTSCLRGLDNLLLGLLCLYGCIKVKLIHLLYIGYANNSSIQLFDPLHNSWSLSGCWMISLS